MRKSGVNSTIKTKYSRRIETQRNAEEYFVVARGADSCMYICSPTTLLRTTRDLEFLQIAEQCSQISIDLIHSTGARKVLWNFPSKACETSHKINFENNTIETNKDVEFYGEKIVIFYEFGFALYPYFKNYNESNPINNGTPQNCDLEKHLQEVANNITKRIPQQNFSGLGIIDLEEWRPLFDENGYGTKRVYQNVSIKIARQNLSSEASESVVKAEAIKEFNEAAKNFFVKTIQKAKEMREKAKWGFYGFPYCNYDAGKKREYKCSKRYQDWNNEMMFIFNESTALFPSIYLGFNASSEQRFRYVQPGLFQAILTEARRIAKKFDPPLPIYAYTKIEYDPLKERDHFYDDDDLLTTIRQPADLGVDGIIIWSSSNNMTDRCSKIKDEVEKRIGPNITKTVEGHKKCRTDKCSDHGKCILPNSTM
ncbi:hyaluronoglucosaminidase [Necator americanus]|uniref:Hyaluronidase n=1 Tax=Necator americanus TaxID=51031 RepID=W2SZ94_NECAM|nr:hyaluronoglucosaminidase [Necator americanus]ETN74271.1 hyaluronoglucosaminidase [Necator americanus]